jgi:hypothetical protein
MVRDSWPVAENCVGVARSSEIAGCKQRLAEKLNDNGLTDKLRMAILELRKAGWSGKEPRVWLARISKWLA